MRHTHLQHSKTADPVASGPIVSWRYVLMESSPTPDTLSINLGILQYFLFTSATDLSNNKYTYTDDILLSPSVIFHVSRQAGIASFVQIALKHHVMVQLISIEIRTWKLKL